jgi:hypothetical protein
LQLTDGRRPRDVHDGGLRGGARDERRGDGSGEQHSGASHGAGVRSNRLNKEFAGEGLGADFATYLERLEGESSSGEEEEGAAEAGSGQTFATTAAF